MSFSNSPHILCTILAEDALYTLMKYLATANADAAQIVVTAVFEVVYKMREFQSYYSSGSYYPWTQCGEQRQLVDTLLCNVVVCGPRYNYDFHQ